MRSAGTFDDTKIRQLIKNSNRKSTMVGIGGSEVPS